MDNKNLQKFKVGDTVNTYQLAGIYDTYILLSNTELQEDGSTQGVIEYIGKEQTPEMKEVLNKCKVRDSKKPMIYAQKKIVDGVYSL